MASRAALVASAPGGRSDKRRDRTHPTRGLPPIPRTVPTQKPLPNASDEFSISTPIHKTEFHTPKFVNFLIFRLVIRFRGE